MSKDRDIVSIRKIYKGRSISKSLLIPLLSLIYWSLYTGIRKGLDDNIIKGSILEDYMKNMEDNKM